MYTSKFLQPVPYIVLMPIFIDKLQWSGLCHLVFRLVIFTDDIAPHVIFYHYYFTISSLNIVTYFTVIQHV